MSFGDSINQLIINYYVAYFMTVIFLPRPSHINTFRHIEPKWTCSRARFTLVANPTANAFAVHWTGRVKITTVPNQTEPKRTGIGQNHALRLSQYRVYDLSEKCYAAVNTQDSCYNLANAFEMFCFALGRRRQPYIIDVFCNLEDSNSVAFNKLLYTGCRIRWNDKQN